MKIKLFIQKILNLLLPQRCLSCRKFGEIICDSCLARMPRESNAYGIITLFPYSDPVIQKAIWLLKYKGVSGVARPLAKAAHERLIEDLSSLMELSLALGDPPGSEQATSKIILVPAPLSAERLRERGFNQAEVIAGEICKIDDRSFELRADILKKVKNTPSQVSIKNRANRIKNLRGAFVLVDKKAIRGRVILLIDDVTTTGTTLNECARVLRSGRPRQIIKVALAH